MEQSEREDSRSAYPPSPVPSDENLLPGDLPFTAFGQFGEGKMDNRVFDQDVYWVNIRGEGFRLEEMSAEYKSNVIAFLMENAEYFHAHAALRAAAETVVAAMEGKIHAELILQELGMPRIDELDPLDWLEATPLMRRLRALAT